MNFILMQYEYPPVIIKTEDKLNYYRVLQQAYGEDMDAFVAYMAVNLVRSLEIMLAGARGESIEEPDDLDKELALLEQRMKGLGKKVVVLMSKEVIAAVCTQSFWKLATELYSVQAKFKDYYAQFSASIRDRNGNFSIEMAENVLGKFLEKLGESTYNAEFECTFYGFRQIGIGPINFNCSFEFRFGLTSYVVMMHDKTIYERGYDAQLTDVEIKGIVNEEAKRHLNLIQVSLDSFEGKT